MAEGIGLSRATAQVVSLNGDWHFAPDPGNTLKVEQLPSGQEARPIRVPSSWQTQFVDLRDYAGVAWYWRSISLEKPPEGRIVLLRFGAVDYRAEVYVNGQKAGVHEGGYLPFEFDVTSLARSGENQIAVRVTDPGAKPSEAEGIRYGEIPHGKQNWYVQTSGLWQGVELDIRPRTHLGQVRISARADGQFKIQGMVAHPPAAGESGAPVTLEILEPGGNSAWRGARALVPGQGSFEFSGNLLHPNLWSPSNPALYTLRATLSTGDSQTVRFGFRTFETRDAKFYLNGKAIYLRGALDQDFYPETGYTPPSPDYLRGEMGKARALGLNLLRCHIKVPDPRYLDAADEAGILIWYEIPNWDKLTTGSENRALDTLRGMADRDWNHPSIVMVSILNESWGANLKEDAAARAWLKAMYHQAKSIVPGWLVEDNSACCDNFHLATDLADFHEYFAIPDHAGDFDRVVGDLATRPRWLFSPYGDAEPKGDEPLMLSEFGNWGLPPLPDPRPWWFVRGFGAREITLPEGVEKRFQDFHYHSLFPDFAALAQATQESQFRALKYEIESLRARGEIQGYVLTEFTDVDWEANGLLDMWRQPKIFGENFARLSQDDLVALRVEKRNFAPGENVTVEVYFSHYSDASLSGAQVEWTLEGTSLKGSFAPPAVSQASSALAGKIEFPAPALPAPAEKRLTVSLKAGAKVISDNSLSFYFYPPQPLDLPPPVSFHDPSGRLRRLVNEMRERGYQPATGSEAFPVLIASSFDDEVKKALQAGSSVILLPADPQTIAPGIEVVSRSKDNLDGNWISSFLWVRQDQEPFKALGFGKLAGFETQAVTPSTVVKGVPAENFNDVLAGMFYGWIQSNVGTLVQARAGKGKLLICAFSLATSYGSDPYATHLLDAMVNYVVARQCSPRLEIPL